MDPVAQFAENVRKRRTRLGLSQEELGEAAELHRTEISLLERGLREPRLGTIVRIARALQVRPTELLEKVR